MKRKCRGCRAYEYDTIHVLKYKCSLGFKIHAGYKPEEECPKPLTITKFVELLKLKEYKC